MILRCAVTPGYVDREFFQEFRILCVAALRRKFAMEDYQKRVREAVARAKAEAATREANEPGRPHIVVGDQATADRLNELVNSKPVVPPSPQPDQIQEASIDQSTP